MPTSSFSRSPIRALILVTALVTVPLAASRAAGIPWANEPLNYTVVDQDLRDLLTEVGSKLNVPVQMTEAVKGRVHGRLPATRARAFLDNLAKVYGLAWYYDGSTLYVSTAAEATSKLLLLGNISVDQLRNALEQLDLADRRWPVRGVSDSHVVMVSGPPHYVASVEQVLAALAQQERPRDVGVTVFHGRVAEGRS